MIRRTDEYCLDLRDGKWYLENWDKETKYFTETDKLFTGIIVFPDGGAINEVAYKNEVKICKDGVIVGDYNTHPYFSKLINFESLLKTSYGTIELADPYVTTNDTYNGKSFTGIAYLEEKDKDGFCYLDEEQLYKYGSKIASIKYFEDGRLKSLKFEHSFKMTCFKPNVLSFLSIKKDYFSKYPKLEQTILEKNVIKEDIIENASYFRILKAHKRLSFFNDGVNDEIFNALWDNKGMEEVEELSFNNPSLTKSPYYKLLNLEKLSYLDIEIDIDMMSEVADTLKFVAKELKEKGIEVSLKMNKKMIEV